MTNSACLRYIYLNGLLKYDCFIFTLCVWVDNDIQKKKLARYASAQQMSYPYALSEAKTK